MKIQFLLDTKEYIETAPEKLQLRQLEKGVAAVGVDVTVPLHDPNGNVILEDPNDPNSSPKTQVGFLPLVKYAVNIAAPAPDDDEKFTDQVYEDMNPNPTTVAIHKDGKTRVTDSNDPEAKLLASGKVKNVRRVN